MTIIEAFRTLLTNSAIANGEAEHTIEFHQYAAEEVGLLGSRKFLTAMPRKTARLSPCSTKI
jgi:leucyl aminopeptidase